MRSSIPRVWRNKAGTQASNNAVTRGRRVRLVRHEAFISFAVVALVMLAFSARVGQLATWYESGVLVGPPNSFDVEGSFALTGWQSASHGYLFPLVNYSLRSVTETLGLPGWVSLKILWVAIFAWFAAVAAPGFFAVAFHTRATLARRLLFGLCMVVFWRGFALYPVADVIGLTLVLAGATQSLKLLRAEPEITRTRMWCGAAAMLLAAGVLTRPVLLPAALVVACVLARAVWAQRRSVHLLVPITWIVLGALVVLVPQSAINVKYGRPINPVRFAAPDGTSSMYAAMRDGLVATEIVATVARARSNTEAHATRDRAGERLRAELDRCCPRSLPGSTQYRAYADVLVQHPTDVIKLWSRHLAAGLDLRYNTPYPERVNAYAAPLRVANLLLMLAALAAATFVLLRRRRLLRPSALVGVAVLSLPALVALPAPARTGTFLPLYVLVYGLVILAVEVAVKRALHRRAQPPAPQEQATAVAEPPAPASAARLFEARVMAPLFGIAIAVWCAARLLTPLLSTGSGSPHGDDIWPVTRFIVPAVLGEYEWSNLLRDGFANGQEQAVSYLVYYASALLTDLDYYSFVWYAVALGAVRVVAVYDLVVRAAGRVPGRQLLMAPLAAVTFSFGQYALYEFDVTAVPFSTSMTALVVGAWGIVRFAPRWPGVAITVIATIVGCFASGMGPVAWPVLIALLITFGYRGWRSWGPIAIAFALTAGTYVTLYMSAPEASIQGRAPGPYELALVKDLLGLPFGPANTSVTQFAGTVALWVSGAAVVVTWAMLAAGRLRFRAVAPAIGLFTFGALGVTQLFVFRGLSVQYYSHAGMFVWLGLISLVYAIAASGGGSDAREEATPPRRRLMPLVRLAPALAVGWAVVASLCFVYILVPGSRTWEDKTMFTGFRSEVTQACLRHYRTAPASCEVDMVPWGVGFKANFLESLAAPLEKADLGPFAPHRRLSLQGEFFLSNVVARERSADVVWSRDRDLSQTPFRSVHHLNVVLAAPSSVDWTIELPEGTTGHLETAVARTNVANPTDAVGVVAIDAGEGFREVSAQSVDAHDRSWHPVRVKLDRYAGSTITLRLAAGATSAAPEARAVYRHPVVVLDIPKDAPHLVEPDPFPEASVSDLELPVDDPAQWAARNVKLLPDTLEGHPTWSAPGKGPAQSRWAPIPELRPLLVLRRELDVCAADYAYFAFTLAATPPWLADPHDVNVINHGMRIMYRLDGESDFSEERSVVVPFALKGADDLDKNNQPVMKFQRYWYPIQALELPRAARFTGIALAPFDMGLHGMDNVASFGDFRLVRADGSTKSCGGQPPAVARG